MFVMFTGKVLCLIKHLGVERYGYTPC